MRSSAVSGTSQWKARTRVPRTDCPRGSRVPAGALGFVADEAGQLAGGTRTAIAGARAHHLARLLHEQTVGVGPSPHRAEGAAGAQHTRDLAQRRLDVHPVPRRRRDHGVGARVGNRHRVAAPGDGACVGHLFHEYSAHAVIGFHCNHVGDTTDEQARQCARAGAEVDDRSRGVWAASIRRPRCRGPVGSARTAMRRCRNSRTASISRRVANGRTKPASHSQWLRLTRTGTSAYGRIGPSQDPAKAPTAFGTDVAEMPFSTRVSPETVVMQRMFRRTRTSSPLRTAALLAASVTLVACGSPGKSTSSSTPRWP